MLTVAVAQSLALPFSDYNESCYLLPVLQMTSCLPIIGKAKAKRTSCILKMTHQAAAPGKVMMFTHLICHYYLLHRIAKRKKNKKTQQKLICLAPPMECQSSILIYATSCLKIQLQCARLPPTVR